MRKSGRIKTDMCLMLVWLLFLFSVSEGANPITTIPDKSNPLPANPLIAKENKPKLSTEPYTCPCGCRIANDGIILKIKGDPSCSVSKCILETYIMDCPCGCAGKLPSGNTFEILFNNQLCIKSELAYIDTSANSCSCGCINQRSVHGIIYNLNGNDRCGDKGNLLFPPKPPTTVLPPLTVNDADRFNNIFTG